MCCIIILNLALSTCISKFSIHLHVQYDNGNTTVKILYVNHNGTMNILILYNNNYYSKRDFNKHKRYS